MPPATSPKTTITGIKFCISFPITYHAEISLPATDGDGYFEFGILPEVLFELRRQWSVRIDVIAKETRIEAPFKKPAVKQVFRCANDFLFLFGLLLLPHSRVRQQNCDLTYSLPHDEARDVFVGAGDEQSPEAEAFVPKVDKQHATSER